MTDSLFDQYKAALRRGHVAALAGDLETALEAYRTAAKLVPERALPIASQGTVLHRLDRWPEAAEAFDLALRLAPDDEAALRARATAQAERGLRSGAAADYERLSFVLDIKGRSNEAVAAARQAAALEPSPARQLLADRLRLAAANVASPDAAARPEPESEPASDADVLVELDPPAEIVTAADAAEGIEAVEAEPIGEQAAALAARIAELGTQPAWVDPSDRSMGTPGDGSGGPWPLVDLPSPPPPAIEGPPPDPEQLLAEAAELIAAGDLTSARDRMLVAVMVHRSAGRLDAALEVCLQLLTTAPGDPHVHLAIANLQLDRGWSALAREKIELLLRLTLLTGDTQAEADVHGLAAERLRDDATRPAASA